MDTVEEEEMRWWDDLLDDLLGGIVGQAASYARRWSTVEMARAVQEVS